MGYLEPGVTAEEYGSGNRGSSEPVADGVKRGVKSGIVSTIERQGELADVVVLEAGERHADECSALFLDRWHCSCQ